MIIYFLKILLYIINNMEDGIEQHSSLLLEIERQIIEKQLIEKQPDNKQKNQQNN